MLKLYVLLISLFLSNVVFAESQFNLGDKLTIRTSGFAAGTVFSDNDFYPDRYTAAMNIDANYGEWALRTQVAAPYKFPVRRLALERAFPIPGGDVTLQLGRLQRLDSFHNSTVDAPGTSGMAMLPISVYRREGTGNTTFNIIDGARVLLVKRLANGDYLKLTGAYGNSYVEDKCGTQSEATKKPCIAGFEIQGKDGNYGLGARYEHGPWKLLAYHGTLRVKTELLNPKDRVAVMTTNRVSEALNSINRLGVKYDNGDWWAQSELTDTRTFSAMKDRSLTYISRNTTMYVMTGMYFNDAWSGYVRYGRGLSSKDGDNARDFTLGTTYTEGDTTFSVERHQGRGKIWQKQFAPNDDWNAWVLSITRRF